MGLNLYAKVEEYLDFEEEVKELHKEFLSIVFDKQLNNIIDIGCGQGAFLNHLKFNNVNAYGIDLSSEQIKICKEKGLNAATTPLGEVEYKFDCATAIFDVVNYIPRNDLITFFHDAHKVLNDGGYFIFDANTLFGFEEIAQGCLTINLDDKFIAIDAFFEDEKLNTQITLFEKQKASKLYSKEEDTITQYYHDLKYLKSTLKNVGFEIEDILNFNLHSSEDFDKQIFICKK